MSTYTNLSQKAYQIIQEAFERIGIAGELMEEQKFDAALRSLNFFFQELAASDTSLWTLKKAFIPLTSGQSDYKLSDYLGGNNIVKNINQAMLRTSQRNLEGTVIPSGQTIVDHDETQAFSLIPGSYCEFNPNIEEIPFSYTYQKEPPLITNPPFVNMIGFSGVYNENNVYSINVHANEFDKFINILSIPSQSFGTDSFGKPIIYWFPLLIPNNYIKYIFTIKCEATQTIAFSNIYLNTNVQDTQISPISRSNYLSVANKSQQSRPSSYYLDRQSDPVLSLWPTPSSQYNCLMISYEQMVNDVSTALEALASPALYNEAIVWGLAYRLACKYAPDKIAITKQMADQTLSTVSANYSETTPLVVTPNWGYRS